MIRLFPSLLASKVDRIQIQNLEEAVRESHLELEEFRTSVYSIVSMLDELRNIEAKRKIDLERRV